MQRGDKRRCCDTLHGMEHQKGCTGDNYRRKWNGDVAQCGCRWERQKKTGQFVSDVLLLCPIHKQASLAEYKRWRREYERKRNQED